jgi:hypothetical protein
MSVATLAPRPRSRAERLFDLLDRTDYRVAVTDEDREAIFRLRYDAYVGANGILPNFSKRLSDRYDDLDNTTIFGLFIDDELAASIRVSVATADYPEFPGMEVFPEILQPELAAGKVIIDPTRLAAKEAYSRRYPSLLPYMITRLPWLVGEYFKADLILAAVKPEHRAFYERVFFCRVIGEPAFYPSLMSAHYLMVCDFPQVRDQVHQNYPVFRSSFFERRTLMYEKAFSLSPRLGDVNQIGAYSGPIRALADQRRVQALAANHA